MIQLKEEAVNEIMSILKDVQAIQKLGLKFGICYHSDSWYATDNHDDELMNILYWTRENFLYTNMEGVNAFYIGGSICSAEYEYKNVFTSETKELAKAKGNMIIKCLEECLSSYNSQYFDLNIYDDGLEKNSGWEHSCGIMAIIKPNAIKITNKYIAFLEQMRKDYLKQYEMSADGIDYIIPTITSYMDNYSIIHEAILETIDNQIEDCKHGDTLDSMIEYRFNGVHKTLNDFE